jgi:hypothetical protein
VRGTVPAGIRLMVLAGVVAFSTAACGGDGSKADLSDSRPVSFSSSDGVALEGRLFGHGSTAVVLSHMRPADQRSWFAFADRLADQGYLVLTYDFRGYCPGGEGGCSRGEQDISAMWQDVLGAEDFVRSQGATQVALIGAIEGLVADPTLLQREQANKLIIAGTGDASAAASAQHLDAIAPPPKRLAIFPVDDHGTDLLTGPRGEEVQRLIETYLGQFAPA